MREPAEPADREKPAADVSSGSPTPVNSRTPLHAALHALADLLAERAGADAELREALWRVAAALAAGSDPSAEPVPLEDGWRIVEIIRTAEEPAAASVAMDIAGGDGAPPDEGPAGLSEVDIERLRGHLRDGAFAPIDGAAPDVSEIDDQLQPLADRLRLKAEAARWRAAGSPPGGRARLDSLAGEVPGVDLWMLEHAGGAAGDWSILAGAYAAAATAASVLAAFADAGHALERRRPFGEAVVAAAEAQSAVRAAFWRLRGRDAGAVAPRPTVEDPDQVGLFDWLREATRVDQIYVDRHMRWQDPADPAAAPEVDRRLRDIAARAGLQLPVSDDVVRAHLKAAGYHARRLSGRPWDAEDHARQLLERIAEAVRAGLPATSVPVREILLPVMDAVPDEVAAGAPPAALRAVESVRAHRERMLDDDEWEREEDAPPSPHVAEAAELLRGRRIAVFGGARRPEHVSALEDAFGAKVEWVETREHQSTASFEPVVARADLALLLIRWCSHSFEDLRAYCDTHGTAYVRLPAGYNPNQVAWQVLDQAGDRLRARAIATA